MITIEEVAGLILHMVEDRKRLEAELKDKAEQVEFLQVELKAIKSSRGDS